MFWASCRDGGGVTVWNIFTAKRCAAWDAKHIIIINLPIKIQTDVVPPCFNDCLNPISIVYICVNRPLFSRNQASDTGEWRDTKVTWRRWWQEMIIKILGQFLSVADILQTSINNYIICRRQSAILEFYSNFVGENIFSCKPDWFVRAGCLTQRACQNDSIHYVNISSQLL